MSFYKEVPGRQTTLESTLKFDTTPTEGSTNTVTSEGVKSAIDGAVGYAAENLQEQINDIAEKAGSGYIPKGEASVATLNGLSGQENGELYTMTDAGTLTEGSLAVVAGDTVAWDATNEVWYKAMDYAPGQYGTNEVHNLPTTITAFRSGDVIAVDGPDGTPLAKMPKDALLAITSKNAAEVNAAPVFSDAVNYAVGQFVVYDGKLNVFKTVHPAGAWDASHVFEVPAVTLDDSGVVKDCNETFIYNYTTSTNSFAFDIYLPACGMYEVEIESTSTVQGNFSFKDYNGNNRNTSYFNGTNCRTVIYTDVACVGIGVWKNTSDNSGTFTMRVKAKNAYKRIEDSFKSIAPDFSTSKEYKAGQFALYNEKLYVFKTDHPAGSWVGTDVIDAHAISLDDSGIIKDYNEAFTYSYPTTGKSFAFDIYLPACGKYTIEIETTGSATGNFSFQDFDGNNVVTNSFDTSAPYSVDVVTSVAFARIGVWKNATASSGTFTMRVKSKSVYKLVEDVYNKESVKVVESGFENVASKSLGFNYSFKKGHFYKIVMSCTSPQYPKYFTYSVKNNAGKNIHTSSRYFYYGYEPLELMFFAEDNLVSVGSWMQFSSSSDNSGTIRFEVFDLPLCSEEAIRYQSVRPIILDTDFAWDVDDAFAIRILSWGIASGKIDLACAVLSKVNEKSVSALDGALCEEGVGPCRIGKSTYNGTLRTFHTLFSDFPNHKLTSNDQASTSLTVYRETLQKMPVGQKCDIVVIGTLVNLSELINYQATSDSLSGIELLRSRVRRVWVMGGNLRSGIDEANFREYPSATYNVLENCPVPLYVQGADFTTWDFSTGTASRIKEGDGLNAVLGNNDYLYRALESWKTESGQSVSIAYDPMLLLTAIEDNEYLTGITYKRGHINFDVNTKTQTFTESADGNHYIMYRSFPSDVDYYEAKLRNILEKRPFLAEKPRIFRVGT